MACPSSGDFGGIFGGYLGDIRGIFGGYFGDISGIFGGNLEEFWSLGKVNNLDDYTNLSGLDYKNKKILDEKKAFESEFFLSKELNKKPF